MAYPRNGRRLAAIFRLLSSFNLDKSAKRQLLALITAAFILFQPALLVGQRMRVEEKKKPIAAKPGKPDVGGPLVPSTTIVISQIYGGGGNSGSTYTHDFIELFNRGTSPQSLSGWSVQYASATGSTWSITNLTSVTLQPGQYYLVQEAMGAGGTTPLPTPDTSGTIAMSGTAGKVALVNTTTGLTGTCPTGASIIDFIGFGATASCSETSPAPAPSNTTGDRRAANGCTDTDNNSTDFTAVAPTPRNTASPLNPCSDAAPSVTSTTPLDNATSVALSANISVTFSEVVAAPAGAFSISCANSGAHGFVLSTGDNTTFTLDPTSNFTNSEVCTVTVDDAQVTDADVADPPNNMAADYVFDFTTVGLTPTLNISDVTQNETNAGTTTFTFNVTLDSPAGPGGVTFDIATADGTAQDDNPVTDDNDYVPQSLTGQTISSGSVGPYPFIVTVNGDATPETNETFFVNVTPIVGATPGDTQGQGTITNDDVAITSIHTIQGSGATSPLSGQSLTTTGIVTLLRTGSNGGAGTANGFFIQEPNPDADPNTSEGIFVFTNTVPTYTAGGSVAVGDEVFVTGTVTEFTTGTGTITEIATVTNITVIDTGNPLPAAVPLDSAILDPTALPTKPQLEKYESMRMTGASLISVAPNDNFFDVYTVLSSVPRSMREPGIERSLPVPPDPTSGTPDANIPIWDENPERIKLDFNGRAGAPNNFYTSNVTFTNVSGPLDFAFSEWRLIPDAAPTASANMSAVPVPTPTATEFTVAGFNIENFNNNTTQRQKAALGIRDIMRLPDIIGVVEIFNLASLQALRDEVNSISPGATYEAYLIPTPVAGITQNVGYLVNTARVTVDAVTQERTGDTYIDPATGNPDDTHDRPPLVLRATVDPTGDGVPVIVVVNHPRSFIDAGAVGSPGPTVRAKRKAQAESLAGLFQELQTNNPTTSVIAVGDYNSYQFNSGYDDSIAVMRGSPTADDQIVVDASSDVVNPNFSNLIENVPADQRYSFIFEGTPQVLDHVLVNTVALSRNTRIAIAHMNADFPGDPASAYASNAGIPELNSDHDAPVAYFSLAVPQAAGTLIISEFRFRGPGNILMDTSSVTGAPRIAKGPKLVGPTAQSQDEFVEMYNNTDSGIAVSTTDGSAGWTLVDSTGSELCLITNGTVIPARGHYLCANPGGYSLNGYAFADTTWTGGDIPDGGGVALFRSNNAANYTLAERLDAAGYVGVDALYREGAGFPTGGLEMTSNLEYSFYRTMTRATGGLPKDTGDNAADFKGVATDMTATGQGQNLGAPGPENLSSPINRNSQFTAALIDPAVAAHAHPNRTRNFDVLPNAPFGTMTVRRTFTNNTGEPVTRLRFRLVEITTFTMPAVPGQADLRALDSSDGTVTLSTGPTVSVRGTTVEQPPGQPFGGGWNTSLNVPAVTGNGSASPFTKEGIIQLKAPVNSGESINVQFLLGVMQTGFFTFYLNIEASTDSCAGPVFAPCMPASSLSPRK